jgi:hypothetical protein
LKNPIVLLTRRIAAAEKDCDSRRLRYHACSQVHPISLTR